MSTDTFFKTTLTCRDYDNQLTSLPDLTRLKNLKELNCSDNQLNCSDNQLNSLPNPLPESLEILYCFDNNLTYLPEKTIYINSLVYFYNKHIKE
jgi:Leucine-rich repeat (LRR) protein